MVAWFKLVFQRTFGRDVLVTSRDGGLRRDDDFDRTAIMFLTAGFVTCIGLLFAPGLWVTASLPLGAVSGGAAALFWRRNALPVKTKDGYWLAFEYSAARRLLPRAVRRKARRAVLVHDATLHTLEQAKERIGEARRAARQQSWSSPLLFQELETREQEICSEIEQRTQLIRELSKRFEAIVQTDRQARSETQAANEAVAAVGALGTSRKALAEARAVQVPQLELS